MKHNRTLVGTDTGRVEMLGNGLDTHWPRGAVAF